MSVLKGRQIGGKAWKITSAPAGTPPGQVSGLSPGTSAATAIPVTYSAASGTAPITYAGYVSPHGANAWTFNASLSSTGGLFTGLTPSTSYDLRVVTSNAYGSSTTDYTSGVTTAAAPPNTLSVSRYDIVLDKSSGPIGTAVTATILPNAAWAGDGSKAITLAGSGVSFPSGASVPIPSGGSSALTVACTITTTGELSITGTNTGGLVNPYPAPFNAFASAGGSAQTLTSSIVVGKNSGTILDLQMVQRDAPSGNPSGWGTAYGKGWGEVFVTLTPSGASASLFAKLIDADSAGATATLGTGTYLQSTAVQVYGTVSGAGTIRLILPASNRRYYLELATDSAWTNPVRLAQRFGVGIVVGFAGPSQQAGLVRAYAYSNHEATGNSYTKAVANYTGGAPYLGFSPMPPWQLHDNTGSGSGEGSSAGTQEFGRLVENQFGVLVGLCGVAAVGVGADALVAKDGSIASGSLLTIWPNVINNKFRYCWFNLGNDASDPNYNFATVIPANLSYMAAHYPACAIVGYNGGNTGVYGEDGSRIGGYTRNGMPAIPLSQSNPMAVSLDDYHWNDFVVGHSSMASRTQFARTGFEAFTDAELLSFGGRQTSDRGPLLASAGTMAAGSRVIRIPYKHHGGATLLAKAVNTSGTTFSYTGDVTAAELGFLFGVYGRGSYYNNGQSIQITGAAINTTSPPAGYDGTLDVTLYGASGVTYRDNSTGALPAGFSVQFASDFGVSGAGGLVADGGGRCVVLVDDQVDTGNGLTLGKHMRPALDIAVSIV